MARSQTSRWDRQQWIVGHTLIIIALYSVIIILSINRFSLLCTAANSSAVIRFQFRSHSASATSIQHWSRGKFILIHCALSSSSFILSNGSLFVFFFVFLAFSLAQCGHQHLMFVCAVSIHYSINSSWSLVSKIDGWCASANLSDLQWQLNWYKWRLVFVASIIFCSFFFLLIFCALWRDVAGVCLWACTFNGCIQCRHLNRIVFGLEQAQR